MITAIRGITVVLHEKTQTGEDDFGHPIYEDSTTEVENVLIEPASNDAILSELEVNGKHVAYVLHIPKGDTHDWKDTEVEFFNEKWKTYGDCLQYLEELTPLDWNKKVKVERYGEDEV